MSRQEFSLFVWENPPPLTDWTSGNVAVYARSPEEAWEVLKNTDDTAHYVLSGRGKPDGIVYEPKEINGEPYAVVTWGGG